MTANPAFNSIIYLLSASPVGTIAVGDDEEEADEGQDKRDVDGWMAQNGLLVDNHALQWWHERTAHNRHHEEGGTKGGVLVTYVLKGYSVYRWEHKAHEEAYTYEAVET